MQMFPIVDTMSFATPHERGKAYGFRARPQIIRSLDTYTMLFESCGISWAEAGRRASAYRDAIQWLDSDLIDEIDGIAIGAGLKTADIFALNCRTEILPSSFFNTEAGKAAAELGECTAIAVSSSASQ